MPTENQPTPPTTFERRNCVNCAFSAEVREPPPSIRKMRVCMFNPPQIVPVPGPQGVTLNVMFPPVSKDMLCNQHRFRTEIANENSGPTGGPAH